MFSDETGIERYLELTGTYYTIVILLLYEPNKILLEFFTIDVLTHKGKFFVKSSQLW